jgi:3-oxoacyl-[acyl-carrier protein] reductase
VSEAAAEATAVDWDDIAAENAVFEAAMSTAVVTGAGSGIGRATALALGRRGLDVALLGRTRATLDETAHAIEAMGRKALVVICDVSRATDVASAAPAVESAWGAPRVVVSNAGIAGRPARVVDTTEDEWDAVLDANLKGTFLVARAFLPAMIAKGRGRFVAIASISSTLGTPKLAPYVASKWGVVGLVKSLAEELRGTGLQALAVLPGSTDTPMLAVGGFAPQMTADEVAGLVAYAALDAPDAMNASAIEMFGP